MTNTGVRLCPEHMLFGSGVLLDFLMGHVKLTAFIPHVAGFWDQTSGRCSRGGSTALVAYKIVWGNRCLWLSPPCFAPGHVENTRLICPDDGSRHLLLCCSLCFKLNSRVPGITGKDVEIVQNQCLPCG